MEYGAVSIMGVAAVGAMVLGSSGMATYNYFHMGSLENGPKIKRGYNTCVAAIVSALAVLGLVIATIVKCRNDTNCAFKHFANPASTWWVVVGIMALLPAVLAMIGNIDMFNNLAHGVIQNEDMKRMDGPRTASIVFLSLVVGSLVSWLLPMLYFRFAN